MDARPLLYLILALGFLLALSMQYKMIGTCTERTEIPRALGHVSVWAKGDGMVVGRSTRSGE